MSDDQRLFATPAGVRLGELVEIAAPGARSYVVQMRAGRFHGFVVRTQGVVSGFVDRCPHAGLPLAHHLDQYLAPDGALIVCSWHGALFEPGGGVCVGGPCAGQRLTPWPVEVRDGLLYTAAAPTMSALGGAGRSDGVA